MKRVLSAALVIAALSGCATAPVVAPGIPASPELEAVQDRREAALGLLDGGCDLATWAMNGRVALSNGKDGGSGRIEWVQANGRTEVTLSAPVTRQSWTLRRDVTGAVLEGVAGGALRGVDAALLLRDATGWDIPVAALGCWLRGARAERGVFGDVELFFAENGQVQRIVQDGWVVEYAGWLMDRATGLPMPARIEARRGDSRVRLVVDRWGAE